MAQALRQGADRADKLIWKARELKQMKKNSNNGPNGKKSGTIETRTRGNTASLNDSTQKPEINGIVSANAKSGQFDLLDPKAYRYSKISYYFTFF